MNEDTLKKTVTDYFLNNRFDERFIPKVHFDIIHAIDDELTTEDMIERMEEREEGVLQQLKSFYTNVSGDYNATGSQGSRLLAAWILQLEEVFYD